jgi:polar amino acid transport system ATP-binding protein
MTDGERPIAAGPGRSTVQPPPLGEPIVRVERVEKLFGSHHVLRGVDLEVREREAVMIIGRSGSGKTTLLRCINFLEEPTAGAVEIDGLRLEADPLRARTRQREEQIRQLRLRAGMLFQDFNLFPHMTALENCIEAPIQALGTDSSTAIERAEYYLELVGEVLRVMEDLAHTGTTMIVVTHEMHFAREAADRVVFMADGVVVEQGPPEDVLDHPQEAETARFLRRFLDA